MRLATFNPHRVIIHLSDHDPSPHRFKGSIEDQLLAITERTLTNEALQRGYINAQYHWFVLRNGCLVRGLRSDQRGYHCSNFDHDSWGVLLVGRSPTPTQVMNMIRLCSDEYPNTDVVWARDLKPPKGNKVNEPA